MNQLNSTKQRNMLCMRKKLDRGIDEKDDVCKKCYLSLHSLIDSPLNCK
jgi:hypothetical protein